MTELEFNKNYWSYYIVLEERFLKLKNYIEFDCDNYACYSCELLSYLQTICSEVDVIFKEICGYPGEKYKNMGNYCVDHRRNCPDLVNRRVNVDYFGVEIQPFKDLTENTLMQWWSAYNGVKHARISNYKNGNLENVLFALAGLYVLEKELYKLITGNEKMNPESEFMHMVGWAESVHILF